MEFNDFKAGIDSIHGYLCPGQEYALYDIAKKLPDNAIIVEIGAFKGKSTACLAAGCYGTNKKIHVIDPFTRQPTSEYSDDVWNYSIADITSNLKRLGLFDYVKLIPGLSQQVAPSWDTHFDAIFVDGAHTYEGAHHDFTAFFKWLKIGGIFALHDVWEVEKGTPWEGVWRVWAQEASPKLKDIYRVDSLAIGTKNCE